MYQIVPVLPYTKQLAGLYFPVDPHVGMEPHDEFLPVICEWKQGVALPGQRSQLPGQNFVGSLFPWHGNDMI